MNRRQFVAGTLAAGTALAGCAGDVEMPDIRVYNESGRELTATFVVTEASTDETLLDESRTLQPVTRAEASVVFADPITNAGTHRVSVTVENGPSNEFGWDVSGDGAGNQDERTRWRSKSTTKRSISRCWPPDRGSSGIEVGSHERD